MTRFDSLRNMSVATPTTLAVEDLLRLQTFAPHLNTGFSVKRGAERVTLTLAEATERGRGGQGEKFSLLFLGGTELPLQQGIHEFEHDVIGPFELFITPVMCKHRDQRAYEAVINREVPV